MGIRWEEYVELVRQVSYGKRLPDAIYLHRETPVCREGQLGAILEKLRTELCLGDEFNVLKLRTDAPKLSFLSYPRFFEEAHPALERSVTFDLRNGKTQHSDYRGTPNPPILHRKERFLEPGDPRSAKFESLTKAEEAAGLFEKSTVIGFKANWDRVLTEHGVSIAGHRLLRRRPKAEPEAAPHPTVVHRHKTALTRYDLSKPVKSLLEYGQLRAGENLFDYGCGLGADVRGLRELGYEVSGWDPVHAALIEKAEADVVNLGYVLNVIEDPAERVETLIRAWRLTRRLLVVSALLTSASSGQECQAFGDGVLTSRNTFQKYYTQSELQQFLEDALETSVLPASLGVFYVFRSTLEHQAFLQSRSRRAMDWGALGLRWERPEKRISTPRATRPSRYELHRELLEDFWSRVLDLGRLPEPTEFGRQSELFEHFGSAKRALRLLLSRGRQEVLDQARQGRRDDLLVYMASANLRKRVPISQIPATLKADVKSFFGSYQSALSEGLALLRSAADSNAVVAACDGLNVGWQDDRSLYLHSSLVEELPTILRAIVAAAGVLFGDVLEADIVRIHKYSAKVTFLQYPEFETTLLPDLRLRTKVNLRTGAVDVFDHSQDGQMLYFKGRYLSKADPSQATLAAAAQKLQELGVSDRYFQGPDAATFASLLSAKTQH